MKRLLKSLILVLIAVGLSSCSSDSFETAQDESVLPTVDTKDVMASFYYSMDSLNQNYSFVAPRKSSSEGQKEVADASKFILIKMADMSAGALGSAATGGVGGLLIGAAASYAYQKYLEGILADTLRPIRKVESLNDTVVNVRVSPPTSTAFVPSVNPSKFDSIGYLHNQVLADLSYKNRNYFIDSATFDFNSLASDSGAELLKYGVDCGFILNNPVLKEKYVYLTSVVVNSVYDYYCSTITRSECFALMKLAMENAFSFSSSCVDILDEMDSRLIDVLSINTEEQIQAYAVELNNIIDDSTLDAETKKYIKTICDVSVNSTLYWNAVRTASGN